MPNSPHILSVDVEDYFQVEAFSACVSRDSWPSYPLRVEQNTERLLDLFESYGAHATFFFVGWIAEQLPQLVRQVLARGHEIACHSYWHRPVYSLTPDEFRADTRRAMMAIEDAAGAPVMGYRAPTWSITRQSLWALDVLAEEGFVYDSSIFPIHHDLYGVPGAKRAPYIVRTHSGPLLEIPPATLRMGSSNLPAAGGGYLRILPYAYTRLALERMRAAEETAVIYLHPWEIDPEQPSLAAKARSRFRHYTGLHTMQPKLERLLAAYRFVSFAERWRAISVTSPSVSLLEPAGLQPQPI